jgi:hypothetical protein
MNLLSLINLSLDIIYGNTLFSNHDIIRLIRFVSSFYLESTPSGLVKRSRFGQGLTQTLLGI